MLKKILLLAIVVVPALSFAQGGGHVGRRPHTQQQQQQEATTLVSILRGNEAREMYEDLISEKSEESDLSESCSEPVKMVEGYRNNRDYIECFDRGEHFHASQYKCYVRRTVEPTLLNILRSFLEREPNRCGGNGNVPRKQQ